MDDSEDFAEDLFREVELEEKLMKEQEQREKFAQDRSFQFSASKSNSSFSNHLSRQSLTKSTNSTWTCSNCSFSNPLETPFCKTCSRPRIVGIQSPTRLSAPPPNHNWKETLQKSSPRQFTLSDPILSSSPAHSQHSFNPTSPEAISPLGFPVLDPIASQTWIYPTNYPVREYQLDIVSKALFQNTLVSLPTGLGKTFIAAVVMFNFYRWFPAGKVIFMAPTRPLVTQQIGACNDIVGIPQNEVAELLGSKSVADRRRLWSTKRVFYCTPQVLNNDLKNGVVDASRITCLVVDECHRAQGDYAYTTVLKQLLGVHHHFRVLGLSATPGTDIEKVQKVIQNLDINLICIRGRDDPDVKKYLKEVLEEEIVVKLNSKYQKVIEEWIALVNIPLNRLCNLGVLTERNAKKVHKMMLLDAQSRLIERRIPGISGQRWGEVMNDIGLLMSLTQATQILTQYGVGAFIETLASMKQETHAEKPNAAKNQFVTSSRFVEYYNRVFLGVRHHQYVHPKLEKLKQVLVDHFLRNASAGRETRVIVFAQFRSSVQEILNFLRGTDCIRATAFVGQQKKNNDVGILTEEGDFAPSAEKLYDIQPPAVQQPMISSYFARSPGTSDTTPSPALPTAGSSASVSAATSGQTQKQQQQVLKDFKSGKYNVLVATCIAEEGLDIGEVDLLVCYEGVSSPTRLLQRKGRTGRKRAGRVFVLLTEGTEVQKHRSSIQKYNKVTNFLKTKSSSLQLCPQQDTLFSSSFHPQLVQERVAIQEYHYSQIGGHTPKKRARAHNRTYDYDETQKEKEKAFYESIRGEHILELIQHPPSQTEFSASLMMADSQADIQQEDPTHQASHSLQTSFLLSMQRFISNREWQWKYPNEETVQWIEEICSHPPKFPKLLPPTSLQGILSESSDSESPLPLIRPELNLNLNLKLNKERQPEERKEVEIMTVSSDDSDENDAPPKEDAMIIESDSDSDVPIGSTMLAPTSAVRATESDSDDVSMFELLQGVQKKKEVMEKAEVDKVNEDSDDLSMYELLTGTRKTSPVTPCNPKSGLTAVVEAEDESDSDEDKPLGFFLQKNRFAVEEYPILPTNETSTKPIPGTPTEMEVLPQINPSAIQVEENTDLNISSAEDKPAPEPEPASVPMSVPIPMPAPEPAPEPLPKSLPSDKSISFDSNFPSKIASTRSTLDSSSSSSLIIALLNSANSANSHSQEHEIIPDPVAVQPPPLSYSVIDSLFPRKSLTSKESSLPSHHPRIICPLCLEECSSPEKLRSHINQDCRMLPHEVMPKEEEELLTSLLDHTSADVSLVQPPQQSSIQPIAQLPVEPSLGFNSEEIDRLLAVNISIPSSASSPCSICHDLASTAPLLHCSHCGITVHAGCYGVQSPGESWRCDSCQLGLYPVTCALCGKQGGGMKLSTDGLWAHVVCVTWNPSLIFVDNTALKPSNLRPILNDAPKRVCCLCNRSVGVTVKCYQPDCNRFFHVSCAQENGFDLDAVSEIDGVVFTIECKQHSKQIANSDLISDIDLFNIADAMEEEGDF